MSLPSSSVLPANRLRRAGSSPKRGSSNYYLNNGFKTSLHVINGIGLPSIDALVQETPPQLWPYQYPPDINNLPAARITTPVQANDISAASLQTHICGSGGRIMPNRDPIQQRQAYPQSQQPQQKPRRNTGTAFIEDQTTASTGQPSIPPNPTTIPQKTRRSRNDFPAGPRFSAIGGQEYIQPNQNIPPVAYKIPHTEPRPKHHQRRKKSSTLRPSDSRNNNLQYAKQQQQQPPGPVQAPAHNLPNEQQVQAVDQNTYSNTIQNVSGGMGHPQRKASHKGSSGSIRMRTEGVLTPDEIGATVSHSTRTKGPKQQPSDTSNTGNGGIDVPVQQSSRKNGKSSASRTERRAKTRKAKSTQTAEMRLRRHSIGGSSVASASGIRIKKSSTPEIARSPSQPWQRVDAEGDLLSNPNLLDDLDRLRNSYLDTQSFDIEQLPGTPPRNVSIYLIKAKDDPDAASVPTSASTPTPPSITQPQQQQQQLGNNYLQHGRYNEQHAGPSNAVVIPNPHIRPKFSLPEPRLFGQEQERPPHIGERHNHYNMNHFPQTHRHSYDNTNAPPGPQPQFPEPAQQEPYGYAVHPMPNEQPVIISQQASPGFYPPVPGATDYSAVVCNNPIVVNNPPIHQMYPPMSAPPSARPSVSHIGNAQPAHKGSRHKASHGTSVSGGQRPKRSQGAAHQHDQVVSAQPSPPALQPDPGFNFHTVVTPPPQGLGAYHPYGGPSHLPQQPRYHQPQQPEPMYFFPVAQGQVYPPPNPQVMYYPHGYNPNLYRPPQNFPRPTQGTSFWRILKLPFLNMRRLDRERRGHWWRPSTTLEGTDHHGGNGHSHGRNHHRHRPAGLSGNHRVDSSNANADAVGDERNKAEASGHPPPDPDAVITCNCRSIWLAPFRCLFGCISTMCSPCVECVKNAYEQGKQ
ncbi:hypothetical protein H4219_000981 [Mycoemilia scoparia]|uniref:Uncharacterized protein n=1 Tax=Mycoemilia scoparia TaxID=417184 RepID=A0A9W8DWM5_9FUNG|nr:hypothetical protein H4219_000981 [Mycoemilia scoparia]